MKTAHAHAHAYAHFHLFTNKVPTAKKYISKSLQEILVFKCSQEHNIFLHV